MTADDVVHIFSLFPGLRMADYKTFVETGTFGGDTTQAVAGLFDRVVTIEANRDMRNHAAEKLRGLSHVECLHGRSEDVLPTIHSEGPTVYYLDAHFCGFVGDYWSTNPLLQEIEFLATRRQPDLIIIDDARMLGRDNGPRQDWREFAEERILQKFGPRLDRSIRCFDKFILLLESVA